MPQNLPVQHSERVTNFLEKVRAARGRIIFALDATASRQTTWDAAIQLQAEMFMEAGKIGGLEVQLVYYHGNKFSHSDWTFDARTLARTMSRISCVAGYTQIGAVLTHIRKEHAREKVNAAVFVGDAMEESSRTLYDAAGGLGVPIFLFQEGDDPVVNETFSHIAKLTRGAHCRFSTGAARELAELLRAVAAFAVGGVTALADLRTDTARKLLGQLK